VGGGENVFPFTIIVDDPAGNSFIENFKAPAKDPHMSCRFYYRTAEQDISLGLQPNKGVYRDEKDSNFSALMSGRFGGADEERLGRSEVIAIPGDCPNCSRAGQSLTAVTDIPHFKEVIIMAFNCEHCGFRNNEVKGGGAVPTFGTEVTLVLTGPDDLKRDVLKSDSSMVFIPELVQYVAHMYANHLYYLICWVGAGAKSWDTGRSVHHSRRSA
jgi:zinc finger protein